MVLSFLQTSTCSDLPLIDDGSLALSRLDRPLLSRQAIKETPLRHEWGTVKAHTQKRRAAQSQSPSGVGASSFFPASIASSISKVKVDDEHVQEKEAEQLM